MQAFWYVADRALEKLMHTMSLPWASTARMASSNCPTLAAEVVLRIPLRMFL